MVGKNTNVNINRACVTVCLSVRLHVSELACSNFTKLPAHVTRVAVAQSSSDDDAVCYVVPVSCTTSCFHTVQGQMHADIGSVCATWGIIRRD